MRKTKGIKVLMDNISKLNMRPFLGVGAHEDISCRGQLTITIVQIYKVLNATAIFSDAAHKRRQRPLYTIFGVCYAAGVLCHVKDVGRRSYYKWHKALLETVFPFNSDWFYILLETRRGVFDVDPTDGVKIQTQNLLKTLANKSPSNTPSKISMQTVAQYTGIDGRRIYEIINVLRYMQILEMLPNGYPVLAKRYRAACVSLPHIASKDTARRALLANGVSTRAQKRRKKDDEIFAAMEAFNYDAQKIDVLFM